MGCVVDGGGGGGGGAVGSFRVVEDAPYGVLLFVNFV